jgi:iduronate 2-sulfatase
VRFDAAYSSFTLCNPARTTLLSGLTPATTGIENNSTKPVGFKWMPDYFKDAGYHTGVIGKITHGAFTDVMTADDYQTADDIGGYDYSAVCPNPDLGCAVKIKDKLDLDARIAKHAVKFLKKASGPFFLAVGFSKPHAPNHAPQKYYDQYADLSAIPLPVPIGDDGMTDDQRRQARRAYYACVTFIDAQVGILVDALEELGLRENTIVVFSGDHGYLLGEHGIYNKHELYNLTSRVPLLVSGPGIQPGVVPGIVEHVDILPTLLSLCDLSGGPFEGVSFDPLLSNPSRPWKAAAFVESIQDKKSAVDHAVYTDRYTYIEAETGVSLYDRWADPYEITNLTDPSVRSHLHDMLTAGWRGALPQR